MKRCCLDAQLSTDLFVHTNEQFAWFTKCWFIISIGIEIKMNSFKTWHYFLFQQCIKLQFNERLCYPGFMLKPNEDISQEWSNTDVGSNSCQEAGLQNKMWAIILQTCDLSVLNFFSRLCRSTGRTISQIWPHKALVLGTSQVWNLPPNAINFPTRNILYILQLTKLNHFELT